jgi:eukaryotic-like serine/threonine-protein kinase
VQALRYNNEGLALSRQGKQLDALKLFETSIQEDPDFALAYSNLAQTYTALAFAKEAEKSSRKAVELSDALPAAEKYLILGTRARVLNDNPKAIEYYEKLDTILPGNDDVQYALATLYEDTGAYDKASKRFGDLLQRDPKYIDALLGAARVQIRSDKGSEALDYLNRALTIAIQRGNDEARANTLRLLGICYRVLNKPDDAVRYYRDALAVNRQIGRQRGIADSLHSLAEVENVQGHSDAALKDYREALQLRRQIGDTQGIGSLLIDMGNVYADLGNSSDALTLFKEALQIQREVGNPGYEALALNNIGDIYMTRGEHEEARTYFERALSLREKLNSPLDVADSLHNVGETYLKTGSHDAALAKYLKALELRRQVNDRRGTAIELHSVGTIFEYQGRYGAAIDSKQEAVKTFRETGERGLWLARLLYSYGSALAAAGRGGEATPLIDEALKYANELQNDELLAQVATARGEQSFYSGDWAGARASFQRAVQLALRAKSPAAALLAELDAAKIDIIEGRAQAASQVLKRISTEADRIGLKYVAVECDLYLGRAALTLGQHARARDALERALTEADRLGARVLLAKAHFWLASTLQAQGNAADARRHADEARRLVDEIRREARGDKILERADLRELAQRSPS